MPNPITHTDQMGHELILRDKPQRIISLVPSQTELLYDLGLQDEVIAQTIFCIHPKEMHETKPRIGGTKNLNIEKIRLLKPDLIIGNKEENTREQIEILMQEFPVWMSDIQNLPQSLDMIQKLGEITQTTEKALEIIRNIQNNFMALVRPEKPRSCLYFIWREPYMLAGKGTFIDDILQRVGFENLCPESWGRYPQVSEETLRSLQPEYLLLSSEPYPFKPQHHLELKLVCPNATTKPVDGELYSWYGSRLAKKSYELRVTNYELGSSEF